MKTGALGRPWIDLPPKPPKVVDCEAPDSLIDTQHAANRAGPTDTRDEAARAAEVAKNAAEWGLTVNDIGEITGHMQVWHDEIQRWERTGRLDQGPCWCAECVNDDEGDDK